MMDRPQDRSPVRSKARSASDNAGYGWRVTVPATSANLGCAFDCGGLALKLYLRASFVPSGGPGLTVHYSGETADRVPVDDSNLVARALQFVAAHFGAPAPDGQILVETEIPVGVGLGSSAAAVIAGLLLGARYCGEDPIPEQLLAWAEKLEGHIDNSAAAYYGGLVFALCNNTDRIVALKTKFPEDIKLVVVTPAVVVPTHEARRVP